MVTVELAIGFLTATMLTAVLAGLVLIGVTQAAADRASTEMARQYARGDTAAAQRAQAAAPEGSVFDLHRDDDGIRVRVSSPVQVFGLTGLELTSQAWSRWEPGAAP